MFQQINKVQMITNNTTQNAKINDFNKISGESDQSQHSEFILNGLQILKSNKILCDVTLIAESKISFI
jgi:hypothetical protein